MGGHYGSIHVRTDDREQVRDAVDQILAKPEYRARAMEMAREFAAYDSAKKLPELLEALVTERQVRAHGV